MKIRQKTNIQHKEGGHGDTLGVTGQSAVLENPYCSLRNRVSQIVYIWRKLSNEVHLEV